MAIVKICKKHGNLSVDQVYKSKTKTNEEGFHYKCKQCVAEASENRVCSVHGLIHKDIRKANGRCKLCHRKSANKKRNENREWFNEKQKIKREADPEKTALYYKQQYIKKRERLGEKYNDFRRAQRFNITIDYYYEMIAKQKNKCAICGLEETRKKPDSEEIQILCVDHDHKTGKVRELLCHACNIGLGKFKDSLELLKSAIDYLNKHKPI